MALPQSLLSLLYNVKYSDLSDPNSWKARFHNDPVAVCAEFGVTGSARDAVIAFGEAIPQGQLARQAAIPALQKALGDEILADEAGNGPKIW
jgi:hypothetical protein